MTEIKEEERIAKEKEEKKKVEAARAKVLADKRAAKISIQKKEFRKYSDWKFWATRLTFPGKIVKPNCVVYETTKVLYQKHDWRDRYGNREPGMDSQVCWVPKSVVFDKIGFKYITVWANYGDIGGNPPGPRGIQDIEDWSYFPEYQLSAEHVNCITLENQSSNIARLTRLKQSDPEIIDLGQLDRGERIVNVIDPVTKKVVAFAKPIWVVEQYHQKYSGGTVRHAPTLSKIVSPTCDAHRKFWSNKNFSG